MPSFCRDCLKIFKKGPRCPACKRPRVVSHPELFDLSIAHMDCDAFFASVEKRDNPDIRNKPVIIGGGGDRGVVSTACYVARIKGVRSAMPMFKALALCPDAVVLPSRMQEYAKVSRAIRAMMNELTPAIEPLSLDEAFLDLTGTAKLHGAPPALLLASLLQRIKNEIGITGSIGLSHNKFLAKIASDLDKPDGFSIIGKAQTEHFLEDKPVSILWGVGKATQASLASAGIHYIKDLKRWKKTELTARFGATGSHLWHLCRGEDARRIQPSRSVKSISKETTFLKDTNARDALEAHLWRLSEQVSDTAKAKHTNGRTITLKLKRSNHQSLSRRITLTQPTNFAEIIFQHSLQLLDKTITQGPFRLIGVGISELSHSDDKQAEQDFFDPHATKAAKAEIARDQIRAKFGKDAIFKGRALKK